MRCRVFHPEVSAPTRWLVAVVLWLGVAGGAGAGPLTTNTELEQTLQKAAAEGGAELHEIGRSVEDRPLWAVRFHDPAGDAADRCVVLLVGQQHGDEPAGTEALIDLIEDYTAAAVSRPTTLDMWVVPRLNPDGAATGQRRNAADFDLNRDHVILSQPETRALHRLARRIRPHLAVDCHEFRRDSEGYLEQGWTEWPLIMMETANLPSMPDRLYRLGVRLIDAPAEAMAEAGFNYQRYLVGDAPTPAADGELRYSTLDPDDCRNGLSLYGSASFIIESGIHRAADDPHADLDQRVAAYRLLLEPFLTNARLLDAVRAAAESARTADAPQLIPTNVFWANPTPTLSPVKVIDHASGETVTRQTPNLMRQRVVKSAVPTPAGYVIAAAAAPTFADLLDAHGLPYITLDEPQTLRVEAVRLERVEDDYDPVYHRYAGRQITSPRAVADAEFPADALLVELGGLNALDARRAALLLEPRQLFGLYQWPAFRTHVRADGTLPVARVFTADADDAPPRER
jgi:hypothetical protein